MSLIYQRKISIPHPKNTCLIRPFATENPDANRQFHGTRCSHQPHHSQCHEIHGHAVPLVVVLEYTWTIQIFLEAGSHQHSQLLDRRSITKNQATNPHVPKMYGDVQARPHFKAKANGQSSSSVSNPNGKSASHVSSPVLDISRCQHISKRNWHDDKGVLNRAKYVP